MTMKKNVNSLSLSIPLVVLAVLALFLVIGCSFVPTGAGEIVYVSDTDGDRDIYVVDPKTGESSRLTNNGGPDEDPRWSPDGRQIAYVTRESGDKEINVISGEGVDLTRLTDNPGLDASPRWAPNQEMLAYVSEADPDGGTEGGVSSEIYSIALESKEVDQITFGGPAEELGDWSPDGEWLVFYNMEPEEQQGLWIRNPAGVNLLRLTEGQDSQPAWSPDGKYIAFVRQQEDAQVIYVGQPAKGDSWDDGVEETRLTQGGFNDYAPAWHPNSKTLAFVSTRNGNPEIYTMQADGAEQKRLTSNNADDVSPVWSPNGKQLAFVTHLYGSADILVMNADGSEQRRLTKNGGDDIMPDW